MLGISGVEVFEVRKHENPETWYYAIVWRGRELTSVRLPWSANKGKLAFVGQNIRYGLDKEQEEEMLNGEDKLIAEDEREMADMTKEAEKDAKTLLKIKDGSTVSVV